MTENKPSKNPKTERRKSIRLQVSLCVEYSLIGNEMVSGTDFTRNISVGGICLIVYKDIPLYSQLSLLIHLPDNQESLPAQGKVIWRATTPARYAQGTEYHLGIEFTEISPESRERIFKYVTKYM